jgi:hypothetical protein
MAKFNSYVTNYQRVISITSWSDFPSETSWLHGTWARETGNELCELLWGAPRSSFGNSRASPLRAICSNTQQWKISNMSTNVNKCQQMATNGNKWQHHVPICQNPHDLFPKTIHGFIVASFDNVPSTRNQAGCVARPWRSVHESYELRQLRL